MLREPRARISLEAKGRRHSTLGQISPAVFERRVDDPGSVNEQSFGSHSPRGRTLRGLAMRSFGLVIGALLILGSAISFTAPDLRLSLERSAITPVGLYAITALRIATGLGLVLAAPASRAPRTLGVLGLIVIIAGLSTPLFGVARAQAVVNWLASAGPLLMRLDAVIGMALGGFLVYVSRDGQEARTPDLRVANEPKQRP